jgi:hypothetical protein
MAIQMNGSVFQAAQTQHLVIGLMSVGYVSNSALRHISHLHQLVHVYRIVVQVYMVML